MNRKKFNILFAEINRPGKYELYKYMEDNGFFTAPASSAGSKHGAVEGGLLNHSITVTETMLKLRDTLAPGISRESCILVGLTHDIGKAAYYSKDLYVPNMIQGKKKGEGLIQSAAKPYEHNKERIEISHELSSLHIVGKLVPLLEEEVQAILFHNGQYVPSGRDVKNNENPLTLMLHWADYWSAFVVEQDIEPKSSGVMF